MTGAGSISSERRPTRRWLPVCLLLGATATSLAWSVQRWWDPRADAAHYILVAQSLLRGDGFAVNGQPFTIRPPGMSLLLVPPLAARGVDFGAINLWVSLFGILATLLLFVEFRDRVGVPLACLVAALAWLNPELQRLCNGAMSDVPGTALALLAIAVAAWAKRGESPHRDLVTGLAVAAAIHVRASNLALLPALLLDRLWPLGRDATARRLLGPAGVLAVVVLLYGPWMVYAARHPTQGDHRVHDYQTAFLNADSTDPESARAGTQVLGERLRANVTFYAAQLGSGLERNEPVARDWAISLAVLAALAAVLARRRGVLEWYAWISIAILAVYFTRSPRLLLPVFVLAIGAVGEAVLIATSRLARPEARVVLAAAVLLAWLGPHLRADFARAGARAEWDDLEQAMRRVREVAAPSSRIGGDLGAAYAVLLGRPVEELRGLRRGDEPGDPVETIEQRNLDLVIVRTGRGSGRVARRAAQLGKEVDRFGTYAVIRW